MTETTTLVTLDERAAAIESSRADLRSERDVALEAADLHRVRAIDHELVDLDIEMASNVAQRPALQRRQAEQGALHQQISILEARVKLGEALLEDERPLADLVRLANRLDGAGSASGIPGTLDAALPSLAAKIRDLAADVTAGGLDAVKADVDRSRANLDAHQARLEALA